MRLHSVQIGNKVASGGAGCRYIDGMYALLVGCTALSPESGDLTPVESAADSSTDSGEIPAHNFAFPDFAAALPGESNHLLPLKTAVDVVSRRAFVVSEALGSVAVVDIDGNVVLKVLQMGTGGRADVLADALGGAVLYERASGTITWLKEDFQYIRLETGYDLIGGAFLEGGILWVLGSVGTEVRFSRWDRSGQRLSELLPRLTTGTSFMIPWASGRAMIVGSGQAMFLEEDGTASRGFSVPVDTRDAALFGDRLALVTNTRTLVAEVGGALLEVAGGVDNTDLVVGPDRFWVLDRDGDARNIGVVRSYDAQLQQLGPSFSTGKNNGFGGYDSVRRSLWISSEGESQLQGYDPQSGARLHEVPLGVHVDRAVSRPDLPEHIFVSGRLSNLLLRYDVATGERLDAAVVPYWPVAPAIWSNSFGQELWVASQVDSQLCAYSMDLELRECFSLGLPTDETLLISDAELRPGGGLLYASGGPDQLVELRETGEVLQRWELTDGQPAAEEEKGRMDVLVSPAGQVFVVRCSDGRISRIDGTEVRTARPLDGMAEDTPMGLCASWFQDRLYVFGFAVNPSTLEPEGAEDQSWRYRLKSGAAWHPEDRSLRVHGQEIAKIPPGFWDPVFFELPGAPNWVGWAEFDGASLHLRSVTASEGR